MMRLVVRFLILSSTLLYPLISIRAAEGVLYLSPERGSYSIGDVFEVAVRADSDTALINAAEAEITFNPTVLSVEHISVDGSIVESWPTLPEFSNQDGIIRFAGWMGAPFSGDGLLATITFRALRNSVSNAHLAAGAILAANEIGSNIITSMRSGLYVVEPKHVVPEPAVAVEYPSAATEPLDEVPPAPPSLIDFPITIDPGERAVIEGTTLPDSLVDVWMGKGELREPVGKLLSARDGSFVFVSEPLWEEGSYRLWTRVESASGLTSEWSGTVSVTVRPGGFAAVATSSADLLFFALPLIALIMVAGLGAGYLFHRHAVLRMKHRRQPH